MNEDPFGVEVEAGMKFPAKPPLEVRADGTIVENEPGAADGLDGDMERFGIADTGQSYALTLSDVSALVVAIGKGDDEGVRRILDDATIF